MADALFYTKNPHTRKIWPEVSELYQATPNTALQFNDDPAPEYDSELKLTLANVLIKQYEPKRCEALLELVHDKTNGETRIILLRPLLRIRNRKSGMMDILSELKQDPVLAIELEAKGVPS